MVSTFTVVAASMMLGQSPDLPPVAGQPPASREYVYSGGVLVPISEAQKAATSGRKPDENSTPIRTWIKSWFKRGDDAPPHIIGGNAATRTNDNANLPPTVFAGPPAEYPRKLFSSQSFAPKNEVLVIPQKTAPAAPKLEMPTIDVPKFETPKAETPKTVAPKTVAPKNVAPKTEVVNKVAYKPASSASSPILPINAERIGRDEKFEWVTGQLEMEKGHFILYYATPETVDMHQGRIQVNPQKVDMRQFRNGDLVSMRGQLSRGATPVYQITSADLIERPKR
jgi:uncharacterized cupin superfamily protein